MSDIKRLSARYIKLEYNNTNIKSDKLCTFILEITKGRKNITPDIYIAKNDTTTIVLIDMLRKINITDINKFIYNKIIPHISTLGYKWAAEVESLKTLDEFKFLSSTQTHIDIETNQYNISGKRCAHCREFKCNNYYKEDSIMCKTCSSNIKNDERLLELDKTIESIPNGKLLMECLEKKFYLEIDTLKERNRELELLILKIANNYNDLKYVQKLDNSKITEDDNFTTPVKLNILPPKIRKEYEKETKNMRSGFIVFDLGCAARNCTLESYDRHGINAPFKTDKLYTYNELLNHRVLYIAFSQNVDETYTYLCNKYRIVNDSVSIEIEHFKYIEYDTDIFKMYQEKINEYLLLIKDNLISIDKGLGGIDIGDNTKYKVVSIKTLLSMQFVFNHVFNF